MSMYPVSVPFHGQAVNITAESYCDRLDFGLVACPIALPVPAAAPPVVVEDRHRLAAPTIPELVVRLTS
jgi:hypothetical protein